MNIAVVGAGAMGELFGALLAEAGHEIWLHDVRPEVVAAIERDGITIERDGVERTVRVPAREDPAAIPRAELVLVFVKSYQTERAAGTVALLAGDAGLVLTLQNGMGNAELLAARVGAERVLAGTTAHGATLLAPGRIRHAGAGATTIGPWSYGATNVADEIARTFSAAGLSTRTASDVRAVLWEKLLVNIGINAITALTGIRNGRLLDLEPARRVSVAAVQEAVRVARAAGVTVRADITTLMFQIALATAGNRSSMGQDVDHHRPTEIAAINGYVVRLAARLGVEVPVNGTLTGLIETLETCFAAELSRQNAP